MMPTLAEELKSDEGERLGRPYKDSVGIWTGGVGHNLEGHYTQTQIANLVVTQGMSDSWLRGDIQVARHDLARNLPWVADLDPVRRQVLENMCFNLGWARLARFKDTCAAIRRGDYPAAAKDMLQSQWATQVGARAERLARRMATGVY